MKILIFTWYILTNQIVLQKTVDGRKTYRMEFNQPTQITESDSTFYGTTVDYAYKGEIYNYIQTKKFVYNEDL
jgi:hypothetical protein